MQLIGMKKKVTCQVAGKMTEIQSEKSVHSVGCFPVSSFVATRSMARISRSQTSNMVECESITSRVGLNRGCDAQDPEYFLTRQADVSNRYQEPSRYKYINHNAKLTMDGKPMICQDIPRSIQLMELLNQIFLVLLIVTVLIK